MVQRLPCVPVCNTITQTHISLPYSLLICDGRLQYSPQQERSKAAIGSIKLPGCCAWIDKHRARNQQARVPTLWRLSATYGTRTVLDWMPQVVWRAHALRRTCRPFTADQPTSIGFWEGTATTAALSISKSSLMSSVGRLFPAIAAGAGYSRMLDLDTSSTHSAVDGNPSNASDEFIGLCLGEAGAGDVPPVPGAVSASGPLQGLRMVSRSSMMSRSSESQRKHDRIGRAHRRNVTILTESRCVTTTTTTTTTTAAGAWCRTQKQRQHLTPSLQYRVLHCLTFGSCAWKSTLWTLQQLPWRPLPPTPPVLSAAWHLPGSP